MKRFINSAIPLFALFSASLGQGQQPQRSVSDVVKATVESVVLIVINDESGKPIAEGSGFIASSDGKIVTNHHVIAGAHSAVVKLNNGAFFAVDGVLADDPDHDIAVIKVSGKNLPTLPLANSDSLSAGDHVVAIGSPLGLENSVSDGIISGFREDPKGRSWLQTTAPASHGNSGGPLLTMDEHVAGVVTWKAAEGENLNFAVPSKLIAALLTNSIVKPLGATQVTDSSVAASKQERLWTSLTSGRDFKLRIDGDYIYTEWVNMPSALQSSGASMRQELKKAGDRWVGKTYWFFPSNYRGSVKWCRTETELEINRVSESRIEGQAQGWGAYDVKNCKPEKVESKPFTWIPK
jgi:S1-C subfamily serine protease